MKKKILSFILSSMFVLSACKQTTPDIQFNVENGYIQYYDGKNWQDLIAVEELKGEAGVNGIGKDGREVEFRATTTHIQWRYVDSNQEQNENWVNIISFEEMSAKPETNPEETNQAGFNLFKQSLQNIYRTANTVTYDYGSYQVKEYNAVFGVDNSNTLGAGNVYGLMMRCNTNREYKPLLDGEGNYYLEYYCNLYGLSHGEYEASKSIQLTLKKDLYSDVFEVLEGKISNVTIQGFSDSDAISMIYADGQMLNDFKQENIKSVEFNDNGDCVVSFYRDAPVSDDVFDRDYIYEFCLTSEGAIKKIMVYEKDFLNPNEKGLLYCVITYEKENYNLSNSKVEDMIEIIKIEEYEGLSVIDILNYVKK